MGWSKITKYHDRISMTTTNLVEITCLTRLLWPVEITCGQGSKYFGHEFKNKLIQQELYIKPNPYTLVNIQANIFIKSINQFLVNIVIIHKLQE